MEELYINMTLYVGLLVCFLFLFEEQIIELEQVIGWCIQHPIKSTRNTFNFIKSKFRKEKSNVSNS